MSSDLEWASAIAAQVALSAEADPARPFNGLQLYRITPGEGARFDHEEREALLSQGISTIKILPSGPPRIERLVTTYSNPEAEGDESYYSLNTPLTLARLRYEFVKSFETQFPRYKLAGNSAQVSPGALILTPNIAKAHCIAIYRGWMEAGLVQDMEGFKEDLLVEINPKDPTCLMFELAPRLICQLNIIKAKLSFSLGDSGGEG